MKMIVLAGLLALFAALGATPAMATASRSQIPVPTQDPVARADVEAWTEFSSPVAQRIKAERAYTDPDYEEWARASNTANGAIINKNNAQFQVERAAATAAAKGLCGRIKGCAGF